MVVTLFTVSYNGHGDSVILMIIIPVLAGYSLNKKKIEGLEKWNILQNVKIHVPAAPPIPSKIFFCKSDIVSPFYQNVPVQREIGV